MPARTSRPRPADRAGVHHLRSTAVLRALVRGAGLRPSDHVFDLGAGPGTLTAALAASGATVTAVERDPRFAAQLRRRFAGRDGVRVLERDLRAVRVPREAKVVANPPFALSTVLLGALLDPPGSPRADVRLLVERGFALRVGAALPRSRRVAWWAARYELARERSVPRTAFAPAPAVDAVLLRIRARQALNPAAEQRLRALLDAAYARPDARAAAVARRVMGRRAGPRLLRAAGGDPDARGVHVAPAVWAAVARGPAAGGCGAIAYLGASTRRM